MWSLSAGNGPFGQYRQAVYQKKYLKLKYATFEGGFFLIAIYLNYNRILENHANINRTKAFYYFPQNNGILFSEIKGNNVLLGLFKCAEYLAIPSWILREIT